MSKTKLKESIGYIVDEVSLEYISKSPVESVEFHHTRSLVKDLDYCHGAIQGLNTDLATLKANNATLTSEIDILKGLYNALQHKLLENEQILKTLLGV